MTAFERHQIAKVDARARRAASTTTAIRRCSRSRPPMHAARHRSPRCMQPGYADRRPAAARRRWSASPRPPASTGDDGAPHEGEGKGGAAAERGGRPGMPARHHRLSRSDRGITVDRSDAGAATMAERVEHIAERRRQGRPRLFRRARHLGHPALVAGALRCEVVAFAADVGQGEELEPARPRPLTGAARSTSRTCARVRPRLRLPDVRANAIYEGGTCSAPPSRGR